MGTQQTLKLLRSNISKRFSYFPRYTPVYDEVSNTETPLQYQRILRTTMQTPGFNLKKKKKEFVKSLYYDVKSTIRQHFDASDFAYSYIQGSEVARVVYNGSLYGNFFDYGFEPVGPPAAGFSAQHAYCVSKIISRVKNSDLNLAQAYAERKQTAVLLMSSSYRISSALTLLKKGFSKSEALLALTTGRVSLTSGTATRAKRLASTDLASLWLEIQYGWKPLLNDVFNSAESIAKAILGEEKTVATAKAEYTYEKITKVVKLYAADGVTPQVSINFREFGTYGTRYKVSFTLGNQAYRTMAQLGISNPLLLAWELLGYSFVVDWLLPVGDYLTSFDYNLGLNLKDAFYTERKNYSVTASMSTHEVPSVATSLFSFTGQANAGVSVKHFTRTPLDSWPLPELPRFKDPFSRLHLANALALLTLSFNNGSHIGYR